jgi:hypothetical protein
VNLTLNRTSGSTHLVHFYHQTAISDFQAVLIEQSNSSFVTVTTEITTVVSGSPLQLFVHATNDTNPPRASTAFAWVLFGGLPPYHLSIQFGDGSVWTAGNLTPGFSACSCGGNVTYHTYGPVSVATTYAAVVTLQDSGGVNNTTAVSVLPSYNIQTGGSGGGGNLTRVLLHDTNGSAQFFVGLYYDSAPGPACACHLELAANATIRGTHGPFYIAFAWGDGGGVNFTRAGVSTYVSALHNYTTPGSVTFRAWEIDVNGTYLNVSATLNVPGMSGNTSGNGTGSHFYAQGSNGSLVFNISGTENTLRTTNSSGGTSFTLVLNGTLIAWGGTPRFLASIWFGDGGSTNGSLANGSAFPFSNVYGSAGNYTLVATVTDSAGVTAHAALLITVPAGSSGNGSGPPHPAAVNVVVAATPVTGSVPLVVTFSAYINGGSPPFLVVWSLPGGNASLNATGLQAHQTYRGTGWYPATAFVYNTTSPYGTVIVGYGSVWVYATPATNGSGGGNGSGNGTGGHARTPPTSGGTTAGGASVSTPTIDGVLIALSLGGFVGALVGYSFGATGRGGNRPMFGSTRRSTGEPRVDTDPPYQPPGPPQGNG